MSHIFTFRNACASALMVSLMFGICGHAQEKRPKFKAGVTLVPITAVVRDGNGRLVQGLARDDFEVFENDQRRPIVEFRTTSSAPVSIALLFDTSSSMRDVNQVRGQSVVDALLQELNPQADEIALFTFDQKLREETPFTSDPAVIRTALGKTVAWGQTSLYDAVSDTAKKVSERPAPRQAVIVITDGMDTSSGRKASEVSQIASSVDVPVYVVAVAPRRRWFGGNSDLARLARETGGDQLGAATPEQASTAVAALIAEMRQQYFLAIESAVTPGWHRIDVKTRQRSLRVRARSGYLSQAS